MSRFNPSFLAGLSPMARREAKRWNSVNTPSGLSGQKLDEEIIAKMVQAVYLHYKVSYSGTVPAFDGSEVDVTTRDGERGPVMTDVLDTAVKTMGIFVLEKEEEFKFGKGKKVVAIADGGKNFANNTVKYVKWFNLYYTPDRQDGKSTIKVLDKTYTYGVDKARVFWNDKIKEGYNRVV